LGGRILLGLAMGIGIGFFLKLSPDNALLNVIQQTFSIVGRGYLGLLKMLVVPLILTSIIHAILNLGNGNNKAIIRISFYSCGILLLMTAAASLIGMAIGMLFSVGKGFSFPEHVEAPTSVYKGLADTLLGMIPSNPFAILSNQNTIAIVIFAILIGIAARLLDANDHDKMQTFSQWIASLFAIIKKLTHLVLALTPYGVLALIASLIEEQGYFILAGMAHFIIAMYTAMFAVLVMHSVLLLMIGQNPWEYFKKASLPLFVAFTTRSSFGTLPVTEETLRDKFKTSQVIASFVPSLGATIGMNACAGIFPAMLVVMTMSLLNQPITVELILMVMFINMLASLGISGIPGTAYIAATVTLTSLGLPYGVIALVQGIDPIIDMGRTAVNINGVMTTALLVDRSKK
jgi:L-cystine uptake protein TcyP (sodium:dicarboxylate symporter family)